MQPYIMLSFQAFDHDFVKELLTPVKSCANRQRKRKAEKSEILTSSPYKESLLSKGQGAKKSQHKSSQKRKPSVPPNSKPKNTGKRRRGRNQLIEEEDDDEEDERWPCLVCGESYKDSRPGEVWVQCVTCERWSHEACTTGDMFYVCHNCDSDDEM